MADAGLQCDLAIVRSTEFCPEKFFMPFHSSRNQFGPLQCRVVDAVSEGTRASRLVVLCHGYGASGDDLVSFAPSLIESSELIAESCRFVFPAAPDDLAHMGMPGGRAWWPINMARLADMHQTRDYSELTHLEPPGMVDAAKMLKAAITAALADSGLTEAELILGGFSQGAMVCTQATLAESVKPAALTLFSGTLLLRHEWSRLAKEHPGCNVLQSHGDEDMVLPFSVAEELRDTLRDGNFPVNFLPFHGGHAIPMPVLNAFQKQIEATL